MVGALRRKLRGQYRKHRMPQDPRQCLSLGLLFGVHLRAAQKIPHRLTSSLPHFLTREAYLTAFHSFPHQMLPKKRLNRPITMQLIRLGRKAMFGSGIGHQIKQNPA